MPMKRELLAIAIVLCIVVLFPAGLFGYEALRTRAAAAPVIHIEAKVPEAGGFVPDRLRLVAGQPVTLRISSPDVVHGFTIPELGIDIPEVYPGKPVDVTVAPQVAGRYAFACTRWCGVDHWRMRGVIEVVPGEGATGVRPTPVAPLFQQLGIDIDAMRHDAAASPVVRPSAARGAALNVSLSPELAAAATRRTLAPADAFGQLRAADASAGLTDEDLWDLVALAWLRDVPPETLERAASLYARDCAACHGETGRGDGLAGKNLPGMAKMDPMMPAGPADFTHAGQMLSASDVLLQGKLLRGGMGTGMPEFGSLYSEEELWGMVTHLRTFLFDR